jgi:hypothetical protein
MDIVQEVMLVHAQFVQSYYHARWVPKDENIKETLDLLKSPLPGFDPYTKKDMLERLRAFHKCRETWLVSCKHNYSVFIKHFHRWLPAAPVTPQRTASVPPSGATRPYRCPECNNELPTPGEICEKCFPHCPECGEQHSKSDTCAEFKERMNKLNAIFHSQWNRGKGPVNLTGEKIFDDKKEFTEKDGKLMRSK